MRALLLTLLLTAGLAHVGSTQNRLPRRLSHSAVISLQTSTPGHELYRAFGHAAFRIQDPAQGLDVVFNYGTFNFSQPGFYGNFIKGKLWYTLSASGRFDYNPNYQHLIQQNLNLSPAQKNELYRLLLINYQPENRGYLYDFFYDNCATRLRDLLDTVLGDSLVYDTSVLPPDESFRSVLLPCLQEKPWVSLGIQTAIGVTTDKAMTPADYQYLPDYQRMLFAQAEIRQPDGALAPLVSHTQTLNQPKQPMPETAWFITPSAIMPLLFLLIGLVTWRQVKAKKHRSGIDAALFGLLGFMGLFMLALWLGTEHVPASKNWNLLWALPSHMVAAILLMGKRRPSWLRYYMMGAAGLTLVTLLVWYILPQELPLLLIPLMLATILRAGYYAYFYRKA